MITRLEWDSNFFGYPIGKISISKNEAIDLKEFQTVYNDYKLIYVFSDYLIQNNSQIKLVDTKVKFLKNCEKDSKLKEIVEYDSSIHNYSQLEQLAYLSGKYSRYKLDQNFENGEFKKLYKEWLTSSIGKTIADKIFIFADQNNIGGFITLNNLQKQETSIGLIAVAPNYQGQHIGSKLIRYCENESLLHGSSKISVFTQSENEAAMKLYKKNGFEINSIQYIYHIWNK